MFMYYVVCFPDPGKHRIVAERKYAQNDVFFFVSSRMDPIGDQNVVQYIMSKKMMIVDGYYIYIYICLCIALYI